jgi:hypothetical protein
MGIAKILAENQRLRAKDLAVSLLAGELTAREAQLAIQLEGIDALKRDIAERDRVIATRDQVIATHGQVVSEYEAKLAAVIAASEALKRQLDLLRIKRDGPRQERFVPVILPKEAPEEVSAEPQEDPALAGVLAPFVPVVEVDIERKSLPKPRGVQRRRDLSECHTMTTRVVQSLPVRKVECTSCRGPRGCLVISSDSRWFRRSLPVQTALLAVFLSPPRRVLPFGIRYAAIDF